jgi:serine/threonine protein kinase
LLLKYITRRDFHEFFRPLRKIGRGNFATVYLAEDVRGCRKVAVKAFMKEVSYKGEGKPAIENEIKLMRRVKNSNVVSLHGVYETKNSVYLSMEYADGNTLEAFMRKNKFISIEQRRKIMKGLLTGLREFARLKIVHRDLKPENIVVSDNCEVVKILDFGLATDID